MNYLKYLRERNGLSAVMSDEFDAELLREALLDNVPFHLQQKAVRDYNKRLFKQNLSRSMEEKYGKSND